MLTRLRMLDERGRRAPEVLYGRRKMTAWLARNGFPGLSKHAVDRLMRDEGMNGLVRGRKTRTTTPAKDGIRVKDLLNRMFTAPRPNLAWVTDFTYVSAWCGFGYIALAIDLYSRVIVGWSVSTVKDTGFVEACLKMALWPRDDAGHLVIAGSIHHSDAGSQCTSVRFTETLVLEGLAASIGIVGDVYDNAAAETAMGLFRNQAVADGSPFRTGPLKTVSDVEAITLAWLDWCNRQRLHCALDNVPPDEYEAAYHAQSAPSLDGTASKEAA